MLDNINITGHSPLLFWYGIFMFFIGVWIFPFSIFKKKEDSSLKKKRHKNRRKHV